MRISYKPGRINSWSIFSDTRINNNFSIIVSHSLCLSDIDGFGWNRGLSLWSSLDCDWDWPWYWDWFFNGWTWVFKWSVKSLSLCCNVSRVIWSRIGCFLFRCCWIELGAGVVWWSVTRIWVGVWQWRNLFFSLFDGSGIIKGIIGCSHGWTHSALFWLVVCMCMIYTTDVNFNIVLGMMVLFLDRTATTFCFDFSDWSSLWNWNRCCCNRFNWSCCTCCCLAFSLVNQFVLFQCERSSECFVADITLECFDFCVCLLMWFEIWNLAKCSSTNVTLVWFLSYKLFC